ncbi:MAG: 3-phosphoshikimate 1-carboxyvinyltransferase [Bacteroidota bacterium]|nr:3-phosphoshikimate 1-carboxyvinyltransferase [Bacteroidota bacterium]
MENAIYIKKNKGEILAKVNLPASKSITNRALIINSLSGGVINIINPSDAQDSIILHELLNEKRDIYNVGHAGTVMRFLTALFAIKEGQIILTGSERMKQRPVKELTQALISLGADIQYMEKEGYPPLKISGQKLHGGKINIDSSISSQFISSILMIAPYLENGLEINLEGKIISAPYIEMTINMMRNCGILVEKKDKLILVKQGIYKPSNINVEKDWSAASYWYQVVALSNKATITLNGLSKKTVQGDSELDTIFKNFGVHSQESEEGIVLKKLNHPIVTQFDFDFSNCPDLAQTVAVTMAAKGIKGTLTGLKSLKIKETDRIIALSSELKKLGVQTRCGPDFIEIFSSKINNPGVSIETYQDHRMAMACAPLASILGEIKIKNPGVVKKSYPGFWIELENAGFEITV